MTIIKSVNFNHNKNLGSSSQISLKVNKFNSIGNIKLNNLKFFELQPLINKNLINNKNTSKNKIYNEKIQLIENKNLKIFGKNFIQKKILRIVILNHFKIVFIKY